MKDYPLYIKKLESKGWEGQRAVFCEKDIPDGVVFEICQLIIIPADNQKYIEKTVVDLYHFELNEDGDSCLALGFGSLYNHSYRPNAKYEVEDEKEIIVFESIRDIPAGEEIRVNYNGDTWDKSPLWFEVKE